MSGEDFPAWLDHWAAGDWADYRARVGQGEGCARAIDAVESQRRRTARSEMSQEGGQ